MDYARPKKFWVQSNDDPRWNFQGEGVCTRFETPRELDEGLKKLEKEYGQRPIDLKIGYY